MTKGIKIVLTERQEKWLINHFKHTKNTEISAKLNISERSVLRIARHLGLHKSRQFMARCQQEAAAAANRSNRINGTYPPKGYIIPRSEEYRFQPGVSVWERLGAKRFAEIRKRAAESWKQTFKKEKARATFGLEQHTCLRVIRQPREKVALRHYLKRSGYIVDDDKRIAYYTDSTQRGKRIEAKPQQWYKFRPLPPEDIENIEK